MRLLSAVLLALMVIVLFVGCKGNKTAFIDSTKDSNFSTLQKLNNLILDSGFADRGKDWQLNGNCTVIKGVSRKSTDDNCIEFSGDGYVSYTIKGVEPGSYSLRYFLKNNGGTKTADMTVLVDGKQVEQIPFIDVGGWFEYASKAIVIEQKSTVMLKLRVEGERELTNGQEQEAEDKAERDMSLYLDEVQFLQIPPNANPEPFESKDAVSQLAKRTDDTYYIEVHGKPSLGRAVYVGNYNDNTEVLVGKAALAGFDTFSVMIAWKDIQPVGNKKSIDLSCIDKLLDIAENNNMKIDLVWAGSSYEGNLSMAPLWIRQDKNLLSKSGSEVEKVNHEVFEYIQYEIADFNNSKLLEHEKRVIKALMDHIAKKDVDSRIISIQLEHSPCSAVYNSQVQTYEKVAAHIDALAKVVKTSKRPILTRVGNGEGIAPHFIFNTKYIDYNGRILECGNISILNLLQDENLNSRISGIVQNAILPNSVSQLAGACIKGSSFVLTPVIFDLELMLVEGGGFKQLHEIENLKNFNISVSKIEVPLASAPQKMKTGYNYLLEKPISFLNEVRDCDGTYVRCENVSGNSPVGVVLKQDNNVYCIADKDAYFSAYGIIGKAQFGSFLGKGDWTVAERVTLEDNGDGSFGAKCPAGMVLCIEVIETGKPDNTYYSK